MTERTEATDPFTLSESAAAATLQAVPFRRFAVIGDSTAAGTGDPWPGYDTTPWADRLARWLLAAHPRTDYLNTGVMGAVIAEVTAQQLPTLEAFHPDLVHITCGGNDLFLREARLPDVEAALDDLCARVAATGARLSMFTLADSFTGRMAPLRPLFAGFADAVRRVAHRHDAVLTEFWDHPARLRPDWLSADLIHLTMAGHAVVAAEIAKNLAHHTSRELPPELVRQP
ncbi:SGNH/GDSL hydrolase family protein [Nocardia niigatensis]|uniref:SGNH/GDSL hydrolase family protein n=1 Tax=Nocardia niigatensis TaxID=209249 RepID=UPI0002D5255D|nr:SGNH/GDSL hydrolase family protein [Nocardia niigatensis]